MTPPDILAMLDAATVCQDRPAIVAAARALNLPAIDHALRHEDGSCTQWLYAVIPELRLALENA